MTNFEMWYADKESVIETMIRNMQADLAAGYDPHGACIMRQKSEIEAYRDEFNARLEVLAYMDEKKANRWCYVDMKRRGVI